MIPSSTILKAKLLIVDDQAANVLLLERLLRSAGYTEVASTQNPTEVTELHRLNKYDLILLDLNMPVMDGFQVMEELKSIENEGTLPVLVITAQPNEKLRALKFGALDFLSKPFDIAEVLARVQNLLLVRLLNLETQKLYQQVLVPDHADRAAQMSLDMLLAIEDFNASTQHPLNIRIGISSGAAVAGIIGKSKFLYDLWGDVVNTASRMESHGMTGRIQISDATRQALTQPFSIEHRGVIEVKGKGVMNTWFLNNSDKIANCP